MNASLSSFSLMVVVMSVQVKKLTQQLFDLHWYKFETVPIRNYIRCTVSLEGRFTEPDNELETQKENRQSSFLKPGFGRCWAWKLNKELLRSTGLSLGPLMKNDNNLLSSNCTTSATKAGCNQRAGRKATCRFKEARFTLPRSFDAGEGPDGNLTQRVSAL